MRNSRQLWITLVVTLAVGTVILSNSPQFDRFSGYTLDEPHVMGPAWEAAARKELFIRCSDNYAASVSACTAYSGLIDSLFIRVAAFITGRSPIISDPEFADPLLQWLLVIKNGLFFLGAVGVALALLTNAFGSPFAFGIVFLAYFTVPDTIAHAFEVSANGEMGAAILVLFSLFLTNEMSGRPLGIVWSVVAGALATVKLPSLFFFLSTLNSFRAFFLGVGTLTLLTLGLLRNSFELSIPFQVYKTYKVPINQTPATVTLLGRVALNFVWIAGRYWFLLPLSLLGLATIILPLCRKRRMPALARSGWLGAVTILALISKNSQGRYYVGFSAVYFAMLGVGLSWLARKASERCSERVVTTALALIFSGLAIGFVGHYAPGSREKFGTVFNTLIKHAPSPYIAPGDQRVADLASSNPEIYVDWRARLNVDAPPLLAFKKKIHVIDVLNNGNELPAKGKLVTVCYDESAPRLEGVTSLGELAKPIAAQCGGRRMSAVLLQKFQNQRHLPKDDHLVVLDLSQPLDIRPLMITTRERVKIPASQFEIRGAYLQEFESMLTNVDFGRTGMGFSLRKTLSFQPGTYHFKVNALSNYRAENSALEIYSGGDKLGTCALNTSDQLFEKDWIARFLGIHAVTWRNKYFPIHCNINLYFNKATVRQIKLDLKTIEKEGSLRFQTIDLWTSES